MDNFDDQSLYNDSEHDRFYHEFYSTDTSIDRSIDLDEYFNYGKTDQGKDKAAVDELFKFNRILVNQIDSYNMKYITQFLSSRRYGDLLPRKSLPGTETEDSEKGKTKGKDEQAKSSLAETKESVTPNAAAEGTAEGGAAAANEPTGEEVPDGMKASMTGGKYKPAKLDEIQPLDDPFTEYEYMDALYSIYDVGKLTTIEYGELMQRPTDPERLAYLEKKFGVLRRDCVMDVGTLTEQDSAEKDKEKEKSPEDDKVQKSTRLKSVNMKYAPYEFYTTLKNPANEERVGMLPFVSKIIRNSKADIEEFVMNVLRCGIFLLDITSDMGEREEALFVLNVITEKLHNLQEWMPKQYEDQKPVTLVLITSLLSWSETPPLDPDEPDLPLTEKDFRKRRHHPNFKDQYTLEKEVLSAVKTYEGKLLATMVAIGTTYGYEQDTLHYLFKMAWMNERELPVFGNGKNFVPLIHIDDLAMLLHYVINITPSTRFVFAMEKPIPRLNDITQAVSKSLGSGKIKRVPFETAFLIPEITQEFYDKLTSNLNMESAIVGEDLEIPLPFRAPFIESVRGKVETFKRCRGLKAVKVLVVGPPGSGKTRICKNISEYYKLVYLTAKDAVDSYVEELRSLIKLIETKKDDRARKKLEAEKRQAEAERRLAAAAAAEEETVVEEKEIVVVEDDEEEFDEAEEDKNMEALRVKLVEIEDALGIGEGKLDDDILAKIMKNRLMSRPCQNQGYVLDGFPETMKQTQAIFGKSEGPDGEFEVEEEEELEEGPPPTPATGGAGTDSEAADEGADDDVKVEPKPKLLYNKKTMPDIIFCLEANNDYLYRNLLKHPDVQDSKISAKEIYLQIVKYRDLNSDKNTLLLFFDELEFYPHIISVETDNTPDLNFVTRKLMSFIGKTANYDTQTLEDMEKSNRDAQIKKQEEYRMAKRREFKMLRKEMIRRKLEAWAADIDRMKEEEEEILAKESMPLRHYLIKFVFPTLTSGLIEVAKVRPEDPIDYLAEYLFKECPDGKSFLSQNMPTDMEAKKLATMLFDFKNFLKTSNIFSKNL